jgi:hypothetical protein
MSKSYIDELRGKHQQEMDMNNNNNENSNRSSRTNSLQPRAISIAFKRESKNLCSSCQSTISLRDIELNSEEKNHPVLEKSVLINPNDLEHLTVEEIERIAYEKEEIKPKTILKPAIKNHNRLTVPAVGDYCIRIPNISICSEQHQVDFNETRLSDALGYLRMYKNHNRIQFNSLQFNDREDLQVIEIIFKKRILSKIHVLLDFN